MGLVETLAGLFVEILGAAIKAQGDKDAEDEVLFTAEQRIARLRAEKKFGA